MSLLIMIYCMTYCSTLTLWLTAHNLIFYWNTSSSIKEWTMKEYCIDIIRVQVRYCVWCQLSITNTVILHSQLIVCNYGKALLNKKQMECFKHNVVVFFYTLVKVYRINPPITLFLFFTNLLHIFFYLFPSMHCL